MNTKLIFNKKNNFDPSKKIKNKMDTNPKFKKDFFIKHFVIITILIAFLAFLAAIENSTKLNLLSGFFLFILNWGFFCVLIFFKNQTFFYHDRLIFYWVHFFIYVSIISLVEFYLIKINFIETPLYQVQTIFPYGVFAIIFTASSAIYLAAKDINSVNSTITTLNISQQNIIENQKAQINALTLQMNPHFMANVHSKLNALIRNGDKETALKYNEKIAKLFTINLSSSEKQFVSLEKEMEWLENYLQAEKDFYNSVFDFIIEINCNHISELQIPPMLLQPLVENAIIHGVLPNTLKKGIIKIAINEIELNSYSVTIEDNGVGFKKEDTPHRTRDSISLLNINKRIELINNQNLFLINLKVATQIEVIEGTKITILVKENAN
jgi:LytS/YehU family sensor histidine kinase